MRIMTRLIAIFVVMAMCGCATDPYTGEKEASKAGSGAAIGAAVGAVAGALTTRDAKQRRENALIGLGVGALTGAGVGYYMDRQEAKLRAQLQGSGVSVTRDGDNIILNMPAAITFKTDSADLRADFFDVLNSVALVLKEFDKTLIDVVGHTDSTGSDQYNQTLSERRANSVGQYFVSQGIPTVRILTKGYGESMPVASNETDSGRQQNRRVELMLTPLQK